MTLLFVTAVCDWCEGTAPMPEHQGWCIWDGHRAVLRYVFRTQEHAEVYRAANHLDSCDVRPVLSEAPFRWRLSRGTLRGIELADGLYDVFSSRDFPAGDRRAFLSPS